jgi:F-type H+-transporting ATPase subunit epsilon
MAQDEKKKTPVRLRVLSPVGCVVDAEVESVMLPGAGGDFTVLADHHDTVAQLRHGIAEYMTNGEKHLLSMLGGVATLRADEVEVFSPVCEHADNLDEERAEAARRRAEERLAQQQEGIDIMRARAALARALLRLEAVTLSRRK